VEAFQASRFRKRSNGLVAGLRTSSTCMFGTPLPGYGDGGFDSCDRVPSIVLDLCRRVNSRTGGLLEKEAIRWQDRGISDRR